ncbi:HlyD family efflux transporter periplasmic adaptor subunit [Chryseobacterium sp. Ch-15]|uniref:HlyD family efflux transporter periplasmic adaptor subunit n=1 Tax=Chryseobacterium muglaense TaxID=2893752 RepID=A0A9Q3YPS1_9FLAO|nr:HlyD family efflux transporter periplasmic adaptor subunit [Chryseobacterium muglaense]MBD3906956.1 HlyD family efflux transporter periplasmic adaptor subunit [Chryseobacterium muglaense]MCC9033186.1 HlyD family efflux transporter periplasmic adaptor subunit [Chryseobacterium muglaense]MCM2556124.1 HlyD family efflux transporter periplasmic adaptor subunit [Chryseobacterium muglaense]
MKNFIKNYWAVFIPIIVLVIALVYLFQNKSPENNKEAVIGMVDAEFVDVSASLPGRVIELLVKEGDEVKEGQVVAQMKTSEIETIQAQVSEAVTVAQNQLDKINRGVEPEVLKAAENLQQIAKQQMDLMNKTYSRFQNLYSEGVISGQERDIIYFKYKAAQKELETANLNVQLLQRGNNQELKNSAQAILNQAKSADQLAQEIKDNASIKAPASGKISTMVSNKGEMVNAGYPMMTIQKDNSFFVKFNLRQNQMTKIEKGSTVKLKIPGCLPEEMKGIVVELAPALGYADWVPEKQNGEFELRTFQIKVKPENINSIKGLRSGMTAQLIFD